MDETTFTAENHKNFITATLDWYGLPVDRVVCLIGDNCTTNKATANLFNIPLLGCRSHRLNLAVEAYLAQNLSTEVELVGRLMSKLSTMKEAGRLRLSTHLRPVKRNVTRWTGVMNMFLRLERLLPHIAESDPETAELIPTVAQKNKIRAHKRALADFKSVTAALQSSIATISESNALFSCLIEDYTSFDFSSYLSPTAQIVHCATFENAISKLQAGMQVNLTLEEEQSVRSLKLNQLNSCNSEDEEYGLTFAQRALKRKRTQMNPQSGYIDTRFLLPSSNHVERLFSMCKRIYSIHRRKMHPRTLEALVFLKENRSLWNLSTVSIVVNEPMNDDENSFDEYDVLDDDEELEEFDASTTFYEAKQ